MRHQHAEADHAVGDSLFGDLDRADIAGVAKHGRGAVANFADDRNRHVAPDIRRVSRCDLIFGQTLQAVELDVPQRQMDRLELRPVESAWRALEPAFYLQPRSALGGRLFNRANHFLASWR